MKVAPNLMDKKACDAVERFIQKHHADLISVEGSKKHTVPSILQYPLEKGVKGFLTLKRFKQKPAL